MNDRMDQLIGMSVLLTGAAACALLLRWARGSRASTATAIGWAILGGTAAGVLLGPTVLGRVLPDQYEKWYSGGVTERIARDAIRTRHDPALIAAEQANLPAERLEAMRIEKDRELAPAIEKWRDAQWRDQSSLRLMTMILVWMALFLAGPFSIRAGDKRQGWLTPVSVGLWAAVLPGAVAYLAMTAWWEFAPAPSAMVAAAVAIGPWILTSIDREAADQAEFGGGRMVQMAGRLASILAIAVAFWSLWSQRGSEGIAFAVTLLALPAGWWIGEFVQALRQSASAKRELDRLKDPEAPAPIEAQADRRVSKYATALQMQLLLAGLAALVAVKTELFEHFAFWPLVLILLLSDDGRWFGAFVGAMLPGGRKGLRTTRLVIGSMSAGPTQLALTALAAHTRTIPDQLLLPLLLGALLIEFTAPARRQFAQRLTEMEEQLEQQRDDQG